MCIILICKYQIIPSGTRKTLVKIKYEENVMKPICVTGANDPSGNLTDCPCTGRSEVK